jgi:hypothetical protein
VATTIPKPSPNLVTEILAVNIELLLPDLLSIQHFNIVASKLSQTIEMSRDYILILSLAPRWKRILDRRGGKPPILTKMLIGRPSRSIMRLPSRGGLVTSDFIDALFL